MYFSWSRIASYLAIVSLDQRLVDLLSEWPPKGEQQKYSLTVISGRLPAGNLLILH